MSAKTKRTRHSGESRNLIRRRRIPCLRFRAKRFLLSQEWDSFYSALFASSAAGGSC
ncbi:MAG: hypothetical protein ACR2QC_08655 [Gammaproteobacteria bacterium]